MERDAARVAVPVPKSFPGRVPDSGLAGQIIECKKLARPRESVVEFFDPLKGSGIRLDLGVSQGLVAQIAAGGARSDAPYLSRPDTIWATGPDTAAARRGALEFTTEPRRGRRGFALCAKRAALEFSAASASSCKSSAPRAKRRTAPLDHSCFKSVETPAMPRLPSRASFAAARFIVSAMNV